MSSSGSSFPADIWEPDGSLSVRGIKQITPYDDPFLFVSRVTSLGPDHAEAEYRVEPEAWYLRGHFVGRPMMPGALIAEGLGQVGTILVRSRIVGHEEKDIIAYSVRNMRFRRIVLPGETLVYRVRLLSLNDPLARLRGEASVGDAVVAQGLMLQAIVDKGSLDRDVLDVLASNLDSA